MGGVIVCVAFSFIFFFCFIFNLIHATSVRRGTAEFQQSANDRDGKVCSMDGSTMSMQIRVNYSTATACVRAT